jgi:mannosyltransferase OCH1-like enzyme
MSTKAVLSNEKAFLDKIYHGNATLLSITASSTCSDATPIPRIAHFIWIGNKSLPEYGKRCIDLFRFHHPNWTIMLWTNMEINNDPELCALIADVYNEGKASDILRYFILARLGGVYIDVDYEFTDCLELIPGLFDTRQGEGRGVVKFFCGLSNANMVEVNNGVMG